MRIFDVYMADLTLSTKEKEVGKIRPVVILTKKHEGTVIVAPMTSQVSSDPLRISTFFEGRSGEIMLDKLRALDTSRFLGKIGSIAQNKHSEIKDKLKQILKL